MPLDTVVAPEVLTYTRVPRIRSIGTWSAALLPFLIVALWRWADGPGLSADDYGQYLMHAEALADGRPYADINYIFSPQSRWTGPRIAPPGLPLVLAPIIKVAGADSAVLRLAMLCFAIVFLLFAGLYFARHADERLGIGVALLVGLSSNVAHASTQVLTDLPFAALVWLVIYIADLPGRLNLARMLAITILGAWAVLFRVTGIALFPAVLLFTVLRYREHGLRPLVPALAWAAGLALLATKLPIGNAIVIKPQQILQWLKATRYGSGNLDAYLATMFESHLHPFTGPVVSEVFAVITGTLMLIGLVAWARNMYSRFGTIFALMYGAMLLLTPVTQARYLWPLFPFFVFGMLNGLRVLAARWPQRLAWQASTVALLCALMLAPAAMARAITQPRRPDLFALPEVQEIVSYMRREAEVSAVRVTFYKPRSFAFATGIPAMGPLDGKPECLIRELGRGRITHVIIGTLRDPKNGNLRRLTAARPDLFSRVFETTNFTIFRFHRPSEQTLATIRELARQTCKARKP